MLHFCLLTVLFFREILKILPISPAIFKMQFLIYIISLQAKSIFFLISRRESINLRFNTKAILIGKALIKMPITLKN